jgi:site-specific recombinase XerD
MSAKCQKRTLAQLLDSDSQPIANRIRIYDRDNLTEREIEKLIKTAGENRWGHRDATAILIAYRHGLRASELVVSRHARPSPSRTP